MQAGVGQRIASQLHHHRAVLRTAPSNGCLQFNLVGGAPGGHSIKRTQVAASRKHGSLGRVRFPYFGGTLFGRPSGHSVTSTGNQVTSNGVPCAVPWGYKLGERVPFLMADGSAASLRVVAN
jgi:hypothetical protein